MIVGILKEAKNDTRVSMLPDQAEALIKRNVQVWVEPGAGINAAANDDAYVSETSICSFKNRNFI
jgi:NAD(P) transhydrogenase subunit alpha